MGHLAGRWWSLGRKEASVLPSPSLNEQLLDESTALFPCPLPELWLLALHPCSGQRLVASCLSGDFEKLLRQDLGVLTRGPQVNIAGGVRSRAAQVQL